MTRAIALILLAAAAPVLAQDPPPVEVKTTAVSGSVWMLAGAGGNIGVSAGPDGMFMIDDQYAPMTPNLRKALAAIGPQALRFIVNTHWHGDHTGGNENFGKGGAAIVAHDNVRKRMSTEQFIKLFGMKVAPSPAAALPLVTFSEDVTFHMNEDEIRVFHVAPAHTDGDSLVHFRKANVVHMGDTFFNGMFPFIDLSSGGSVEGVIAAVDKALALCDASTRIIPGHGPLTDKVGLQGYRDMLAGARDKISAGIKAGKSLDQLRKDKPLAQWEAAWGGGFIKADTFVQILFEGLGGKS